MAYGMALAVKERMIPVLCEIQDLIRYDKCPRCQPGIQGSYSCEGKDLCDAQFFQGKDIGLVRDPVRRYGMMRDPYRR